MKTETLLKLAVLIVTVTVSHMNLKADFRVLKTTTEINHKHVMDELKELKLAVSGGKIDHYAEKKPIAKKKKKAYAGALDYTLPYEGDEGY
jgi:hypothetical protein